MGAAKTLWNYISKRSDEYKYSYKKKLDTLKTQHMMMVLLKIYTNTQTLCRKFSCANMGNKNRF